MIRWGSLGEQGLRDAGSQTSLSSVTTPLSGDRPSSLRIRRADSRHEGRECSGAPETCVHQVPTLCRHTVGLGPKPADRLLTPQPPTPQGSRVGGCDCHSEFANFWELILERGAHTEVEQKAEAPRMAPASCSPTSTSLPSVLMWQI